MEDFETVWKTLFQGYQFLLETGFSFVDQKKLGEENEHMKSLAGDKAKMKRKRKGMKTVLNRKYSKFFGSYR